MKNTKQIYIVGTNIVMMILCIVTINIMKIYLDGCCCAFLFLDIYSWTHRLASNRGDFCISLYTLDLLLFQFLPKHKLLC